MLVHNVKQFLRKNILLINFSINSEVKDNLDFFLFIISTSYSSLNLYENSDIMIFCNSCELSNNLLSESIKSSKPSNEIDLQFIFFIKSSITSGWT